MPHTQHCLGGPEPATRQFTNREGFLAAFDYALEAITLDRQSVLTFYGVSGIGKTRFIDELRCRLRVSRPAVAAEMKKGKAWRRAESSCVVPFSKHREVLHYRQTTVCL